MKNKKKKITLLLALVALLGIMGYGAYSYYWSEEDYENTSDTITISSFDPRVNNYFIYESDSYNSYLYCDTSKYASAGIIECTNEVSIANNGDTPITVSVDSTEARINFIEDTYISNLSAEAAEFRFGSAESSATTSTSLNAGDSTIMYVKVRLVNSDLYNESNINSSNSNSNSNSTFVTAPVTGGEFTVSLPYTLTATQN